MIFSVKQYYLDQKRYQQKSSTEIKFLIPARWRVFSKPLGTEILASTILHMAFISFFADIFLRISFMHIKI